MEFIINTFLANPEKFFKKVQKGSKSDVIKAVYECIIEIYPPFQLEFLCNDLNQGIFAAGMREIFLQTLSEVHRDNFDEEDALGRVGFGSLKDLNKLENYLKRNIVGQDTAVDALVNSLKLMAAGLCKCSSFFFVGQQE